MLWRLHIRPAAKNGKTHDDVVSYCINNQIAGIGWPVERTVKTPKEYEHVAREEYQKNVGAIVFARDPKAGEFIWARDRNGKYYLGRIESDWFYSNDVVHLELDIPNQRRCSWVEVRNQEHIPGKIIACFRPARTFQSIHDPLMEEFSEWAFTQDTCSKFLSKTSLEIISEQIRFFRFIGADDCEDIVGLYLQKIKGYCLIPSSCKRTTIGYEFILKDPTTGQTATAQVKQGLVSLDESLRDTADHVYLFSTEGVVSAKSKNITVLTAGELYKFAIEHKQLLPSRINYWL